MTDDTASGDIRCPRCEEEVESGASFCGNCGQRLGQALVSDEQVAAPPSPPATQPSSALPPSQLPFRAPHGPPLASDIPALPSYAQVDSVQQKAEPMAMVGLIAAILSVPAALIPLLGVALSATALVISAKARRAMHSKTLPNVAIGFAVAGIALSGGAYAYLLNYQKQQLGNDRTANSRTDQPLVVERRSANASAVAAKQLDTPCFSTTLPVEFQAVVHASGSCSAQAFEAEAADISRNALAINATKQNELTAASFASSARDAAGSYAGSALPGFTLTGQHAASFAGSPAYYVDAQRSDGGSRSSNVQLALVYHPSANGNNLFVLVHAANNSQAGLSAFEKTWVWK